MTCCQPPRAEWRARNNTITELNLDDHRDKIVWESEVHHRGTRFTVKIDAASGAVIKNKPASEN